MMSFEKLYNNFVFGASLLHGVMFLKTSLHSLKRKRRGGGVGGGRSPPICKHSVVMTGSERVHMGSVFAGRMMLEATLLSSIKFEYSTL